MLILILGVLFSSPCNKILDNSLHSVSVSLPYKMPSKIPFLKRKLSVPAKKHPNVSHVYFYFYFILLIFPCQYQLAFCATSLSINHGVPRSCQIAELLSIREIVAKP